MFRYILSLGFTLCFLTVSAQTAYYVGAKGKDRPGYGLTVKKPFATLNYATSTLAAGDTLNVLAGTYYNPTYGDGDRWKDDKTLFVADLEGSPSAYTVIRAYSGEKVVLRGDGKYILQIRKCAYLRVEGFEVYGEVENIPLDTALAYQFAYRENGSTETLYRVPPGTSDEAVDTMTFEKLSNISRPTYTDTKGLLVQKSHHVEVVGNHVHHVPGTGLRLQQCAYMDVIANEVHDCSRRSFSGTHALVFDSSDDYDTLDVVKMRILGNYIHDNYNEIYSWAPTKTIITPHIDEGKGISLQRNDPDHGWSHGRFLVANNLTHDNGFSGLHANYGRGIDFINNTSYHDSRSGGGRNHGISLSNATDCRIINNIVDNDASKGGFPIALDRDSYDNVVDHNLISHAADNRTQAVATNLTIDDPAFVDPATRDFHLSAGSPAIGAGLAAFAPETDLEGMPRSPQNPALGAYAYYSSTPTTVGPIDLQEAKTDLSVFPNPFADRFTMLGSVLENEVRVYDFGGRLVSRHGAQPGRERLNLDLSDLPDGIYFLITSDSTYRMVKQTTH